MKEHIWGDGGSIPVAYLTKGARKQLLLCVLGSFQQVLNLVCPVLNSHFERDKYWGSARLPIANVNTKKSASTKPIFRVSGIMHRHKAF